MRTSRARWPRYGSSSSSMRPSSPRGSPARAQQTRSGRWKSPTLMASGSPKAARAVSAAVQAPTPGTDRRRASACSAGRPTADSSRSASRAARMSVHRPSLLEAQRVQLEVGKRGKHGSSRRQMQPTGARCRLAVAQHESAVGSLRLRPGDLLLDDGRHERGQDLVAPAEAQTRQAAPQVPQGTPGQHQRGRVVLGAQQPRHPGRGQLGARPPGHDSPPLAGRREAQGGRPVGGAQRPPGHRPLEADGRVVRAVPQRRHRQGRRRPRRRGLMTRSMAGSSPGSGGGCRRLLRRAHPPADRLAQEVTVGPTSGTKTRFWPSDQRASTVSEIISAARGHWLT